MNKALTYHDMAFSDYTPLLADSIQQILVKGLVLEHKLMTVVSAEAGRSFFDPVEQSSKELTRTGIYQRNPVGGQWVSIGEASQVDDLAIYLANNTPFQARYGLMVDILERLAATPLGKDESFFAPGM